MPIIIAYSYILVPLIRRGCIASQPFAIPTEWQQYLNQIIDIAEASKIAQAQKGRCGEGTKQSITLSLIKQIETGFRQPIHLITLMETEKKGHSFAVYNGEIPDLTLTEPAQFLQNLKQKSADYPLILCDPWVDYHGNPDWWEKHFRTRTDHSLTNLRWNNVVVTNYTLPSFRSNRDEHNVQFRSFMKDLMLSILKGSINYIDLLRQQLAKKLKTPHP